MDLWNDAFNITNSKQEYSGSNILNHFNFEKEQWLSLVDIFQFLTCNKNIFYIQDIFHDQLSVNTCYTKINYNIIVLQTWQYTSLVASNKKYTNDEKNVGEPDT